ncbi:hypothetical protein BHE74_00059617, partial [Ensete ventricosum]
MWLRTHQKCVGSSPRVSRACQDGVREFTRRRPRYRKIVEGSRKACREFAKGIGKLVGNTPGDYRKKTIGLATRMSKVTGLAG